VVQTLDPVLETVVAPLTGAVGAVVGALEPVVESVVAPVAGLVGEVVQTLDPVLETVVAPLTSAVGGVVGTLDPILEQVVAPVGGITGGVIELVEPIVEQTIVPAAGVLEEVLQSLDPVMDPVTGLAAEAGTVFGEVGTTVSGLGASLVEPLGPVINEIAAPPGGPLALFDPGVEAFEQFGGSSPDPLATLLGLGSGGTPIVLAPVTAAAGSISFQSLPVPDGLNELFSSGSYTEYNLALQSATSAEAPQPALTVGATLQNALSALEPAALVNADPEEGTQGAVNGNLTSVLESGGLHGLGWLGL
jgi:hypothetical protein